MLSLNQQKMHLMFSHHSQQPRHNLLRKPRLSLNQQLNHLLNHHQHKIQMKVPQKHQSQFLENQEIYVFKHFLLPLEMLTELLSILIQVFQQQEAKELDRGPCQGWVVCQVWVDNQWEDNQCQVCQLWVEWEVWEVDNKLIQVLQLFRHLLRIHLSLLFVNVWFRILRSIMSSCKCSKMSSLNSIRLFRQIQWHL